MLNTGMHDDPHVLRLCSAAARALTIALASESDLSLRAVEPDKGGRLLVTIVSADPRAASDRLARIGGHLRAEVAAAVNRRRAPELVYRIEPPGA
jgi:ribosome-binding factor A